MHCRDPKWPLRPLEGIPGASGAQDRCSTGLGSSGWRSRWSEVCTCTPLDMQVEQGAAAAISRSNEAMDVFTVGHRRAHVLGGGSLPVRSPVVPVDCAKLHALWSVCMCERAPERGSRDLLNSKSAMPKPPFQAMPGGKVLSPSTP